MKARYSIERIKFCTLTHYNKDNLTHNAIKVLRRESLELIVFYVKQNG